MPFPAELRALLSSDREALREIREGLDRVEAEVELAKVHFQTLDRGYFTPDEDDRVRQWLLAYRGYRIGCYDILSRWRGYLDLSDRSVMLEAFLLGYATALLIYSKSLGIIESFEREPLVRAKINEPEPKFDVPRGFFEDLLAGYSSPRNLFVMTRAHLHWARWRRDLQRLAVDDPSLRWLIDLVRTKRRVVRDRLFAILRARLRHDLRGFLRLLWTPMRGTRWSLRTLVTGAMGKKTGKPYEGRLRPEDLQRLHPLLQPGDLLLVRAEGKLTTALIPGFWSHAALYQGQPADLERMDLQDHPFVVRHRQGLPSEALPFGWVIESNCPRVALHPLDQCLAADHVAVLRPRLDAGERASALAEAFGHLGKPYDFEFDFNVSNRIVCTELVYRAYHQRGGIAFDLVKRVGRFTLTGDDIVDQILSGAPGAAFEPVALLLSSPEDSAAWIPPQAIFTTLAEVRGGWRPFRDPWPAHLEGI